jgi:hypothetical protein
MPDAVMADPEVIVVSPVAAALPILIPVVEFPDVVLLREIVWPPLVV